METSAQLEERIARLEAQLKRRRVSHGEVSNVIRIMRRLRTEQLKLEIEETENAWAQRQWIKETHDGVRAT